MYDIIDFVKENADEIKNYDITYYPKKDIEDGAFGEIIFEMANGDTEQFFMC